MTDSQFNQQLGRNLRNCRKAAGLTQLQAANWIWLSRTGLCKIERGTQGIHVSQLRRLSKLYGVELDVVLPE